MPFNIFNVDSMMGLNNIRRHTNKVETSTERLATGSRINQAKDDSFRNYESHNVMSEISNIGKARQNSTDGASLLQIAEGTCNEVQSILQRIRELSVQSANDTLSSTQRNYLNMEATDLLKELDRIAASSTFNTKQIFGNKGDSFSDEERDLKDWKPFSAKNAAGNDTRPGVLHIGFGAEKPDEVRISLPEISAKSLGLDPMSPDDTDRFNIETQNGATRAIDAMEAAMSSLSTVRSYMGVAVNRMENQVEDLDTRDIGLNDYTAKIRDANVAKISTEMVSAQIRQQAAISILSQSNSRIHSILEILS
jgi:flagellin